jgi:hypothetical protein
MTPENAPSPASAQGHANWRTFSIRNLLLGMGIIALGCVALRSASPFWIALVFSGALFALTAAILLVIFRRDGQRAWWLGFALFGWLYFALLMFGWTFEPDRSLASPLAPNQLLTSRLSIAVYHFLYDEPFAQYYAAYQDEIAMQMSEGYGSSGGAPVLGTVIGPSPPTPPPPYPGPDEQSFANVAHGLWTLVLAFVGGFLALWLHATSHHRITQSK